jgi:hypothetical protein
VYILVKNVLDVGLPILVLLMFLSKGKKRHHDLSVEDNNILLTSTKELKRNTLLCSFHRQTGGEGRSSACLHLKHNPLAL